MDGSLAPRLACIDTDDSMPCSASISVFGGSFFLLGWIFVAGFTRSVSAKPKFLEPSSFQHLAVPEVTMFDSTADICVANGPMPLLG